MQNRSLRQLGHNRGTINDEMVFSITINEQYGKIHDEYDKCNIMIITLHILHIRWKNKQLMKKTQIQNFYLDTYRHHVRLSGMINVITNGDFMHAICPNVVTKFYKTC